MKPTVAVTLFTYKKEKYILENFFNSLIDLDPDEICIIDTTTPFDKKFHNWLKQQVKKRKLKNLNLQTRENNGNYSQWRNELIDMVKSDWLIFLDSDEMLTIEMAKGLRDKLAELPEHAVALRVRKLDLLDDNHIIRENLWNGRPPLTVHAAIVKTGKGRCIESRPRHGAYHYEGRLTIPFNSPEHPKKDWEDIYLVHLWLYKDNPTKRWDQEKWRIKSVDDKVEKGDGFLIAEQRGWHPIEIPKNLATWRKIVWTENS